MHDQHILVRHFALPKIDQYLRITVGTENEIRRLLDALTGIISSANPSA
jgi:histidinol-phosphate aminotransferase